MTAPPLWIPAFPLTSLPIGRARTFKHEGHQLAVFRPAEDDLYATDNRCPHEGFPLAQGHQIGGSLLMCAWHNFTFDLKDGRCIAGDEDVRTYPVRVFAGQVEIDLQEPAMSEQIPRLRQSLLEGLAERRMGQVARDLLRLMQAGVSAEELLVLGLRYDAEHAEFGSTHSLAVAEDVRALLPRFPGLEAVRPLMQLMDLASQPNVRRPRRVTSEPEVVPGASWDELGALFVECGGSFQIARGEALLRGALAQGAPLEVVERWFDQLCVVHFGNFGHALIYQCKIFDFLRAVGWEHAADVLPAHLMGVIGMARDEQIPAHSGLRKALDAVEPEFEGWWACLGSGEGRRQTSEERTALQREVLDGKIADALSAVARGLSEGVAPESIADALVGASAERLLRFDIAIDADPTLQEGWLDVTHTVTFADAVRKTLERFREPSVIRLLFFAAHFVHRMGPLDQPALARQKRASGNGVPEATLESVLECVRLRDPEKVVAHADRYLGEADEGQVRALREALEDLIVGDHGNRAIFVAHQIKMLRTAFEEREHLCGDPAERSVVLATLRFLASPIYERRLASLTNDAFRFVVEGTTPRRLTD